jgi:cation transport regulator ChaC
MENKRETIKFRIEKQKKEEWRTLCTERKLSLSGLIISSVESRILDDERRKILAFIEKQDNIFVKIETNINQVAKTVNGQKFMTGSELGKFTEQLSQIIDLKKATERNFRKNLFNALKNDYQDFKFFECGFSRRKVQRQEN